MSHPINLITYPTRASRINGTRTHWALFIPTSIQTPEIGTLIQVLGTPFTGYGLEFKRNYNLSIVREKFSQNLLGVVDQKWVISSTEGMEDGEQSTDIEPRNAIEKIAKRVDPPGVSKTPLNPTAGRRCQEWTRELVEILEEKCILPKESTAVLDWVKNLEGPTVK